MNPITMQLVADKYIRLALEEDINGEDVTTCSVMPDYKEGEVQLICKEDGIIAGLQIFERVFTLLDPQKLTCRRACSIELFTENEWNCHIYQKRSGYAGRL